MIFVHGPHVDLENLRMINDTYRRREKPEVDHLQSATSSAHR